MTQPQPAHPIAEETALRKCDALGMTYPHLTAQQKDMRKMNVIKDLLPQKTRWSQNAIAKHTCADRKTIKIYAEQIAVILPDYFADCPTNPNGTVVSGMQLTQYQAWVVIHLINLGREIRSELNGLKIHQIIKANIIKKSHLLSKNAWKAQECDAA